mmetsp:Transcript_24950/g.61304  ORF Transcript_24950/g.61304 Transcript_24950/m.61304 type:complete len:124 (+) Transcript_24950:529-900(+)
MLMLATHVGKVELARLLVKNGANVNATEPRDRGTALLRAMIQKQPESARLLIENGASGHDCSEHDWADSLDAGGSRRAGGACENSCPERSAWRGAGPRREVCAGLCQKWTPRGVRACSEGGGV